MSNNDYTKLFDLQVTYKDYYRVEAKSREEVDELFADGKLEHFDSDMTAFEISEVSCPRCIQVHKETTIENTRPTMFENIIDALQEWNDVVGAKELEDHEVGLNSERYEQVIHWLKHREGDK